MNQDSLVKLFVKHLVMAIPWGIVFLVVFLIVSVGIKQQVKEGIQFASRVAIHETGNMVLHYPVFSRVKQNAKESFEFAAKTWRNELKALLNDPQVKDSLREIFENRPKSETGGAS
jgi:hypothetical protein